MFYLLFLPPSFMYRREKMRYKRQRRLATGGVFFFFPPRPIGYFQAVVDTRFPSLFSPFLPAETREEKGKNLPPPGEEENSFRWRSREGLLPFSSPPRNDVLNPSLFSSRFSIGVHGERHPLKRRRTETGIPLSSLPFFTPLFFSSFSFPLLAAQPYAFMVKWSPLLTHHLKLSRRR